MWRFILVTFAFLGWSFYVLSGGADYEPRLESIQARAKLDDVRPLARPVTVDVAEVPAPATVVADTDAVTRALPLIENLELTPESQAEITLASVSAEDTRAPTFEAEAEKADELTHVPEVTAFAEPPTEPVVEAKGDFRQVTGFIVNLRDGPSTYYLAIGSLSKGDEVEVLENNGEGWLKISVPATGQVGWMADWLVTAVAN